MSTSHHPSERGDRTPNDREHRDVTPTDPRDHPDRTPGDYRDTTRGDSEDHRDTRRGDHDDRGDHRDTPPADAPGHRATRRRDSTEPVREQVARQHERFGGFKWGSAFFGWLSANGLTVILIALATAAGAAIGLTTTSTEEATANAETIGIAGGILLLVILALGYFAGGYVAARMARFDGARQGVAVWVIGLLVTVLLAGAGAAFGAKYNVLSQLNLPRIPVDEGTATTGGLIALVLVILITLAAAVAGGKAGERYHRKVDRAGIEAY